MEGVEEGGAGDRLDEDFLCELEKIPAAGGLTKDPADTQSEKAEVIQRAVPIGLPDIVVEDMDGRAEEVIQEAGIGGRVEVKGR